MIDPCLHGVPVGEAPRRLEDDGGVGAVLGVGVLGERLPLVELPGAAEPVLLPELDLLLDAHGRGVTRAVVVTVLGHRKLVGTLEEEELWVISFSKLCNERTLVLRAVYEV